ncbi:MAG: DUF2203 domain-containing protein [Myxococcales bacterium]|nr:DUF2203 domain-containing protein [Polyangiaceae bacterium]MDW8248215.1 DUF2203 domain-containing protein [Myxococcales bacterium]
MNYREFTIEEANALVPELHRIVSKQLWVQQQLEGRIEQLHKLLGCLPRELAPLREDSEEVCTLKKQISELMAQVEEGWGKIQEMGALVKDPQTGLVDFYGRVGGRLVFFCWRFGEESIQHYHELDEGFRGRKPLPPQPRHRLLN